MIAIDYPTITVGERTLVVRYSLASQILMRRRGIDPRALETLTTPENPKQAENWLTIFGCMVAENFCTDTAFSLNDAPTADYWAAQLSPLQFVEIPLVCNEAIKKVAEALKAAAAPPKPISAVS